MESTENRFAKEPGKFVSGLMEWVEQMVFAVVVLVVICTFFARIITVVGSSMEPNFYERDKVLIVNTPSGVEQGDVVVIVNRLDDPIIKRVIATEGQVVSFDEEKRAVLVDGVIVDDSQFGVENGITTLYSSIPALDFPQEVPEGCVFVLGDNREVSNDSRYQDIGMVDERNILGKAVLFLFPFSKIGVVK